MPLKLVFLGRLEDAAGAGEREVGFAASLDAVLDRLHPQLASALLADRIKVAVNGKVVRDRSAVSLQDGDEIAFLPPVSGG